MVASLSVTHGFLPPHPAPTAIAVIYGADISLTLLYGIILAIPTIILAGPVFGSTLKNFNIYFSEINIFQKGLFNKNIMKKINIKATTAIICKKYIRNTVFYLYSGILKNNGYNVMKQDNTDKAMVLGLLFAYLIKAANSLVRFAVIDGFSVEHTPYGEPLVNYNATKYNLDLKECHSITSNFIVDPTGVTHSADRPEFALSKAQDLFSWSTDTLTAMFNNTLNTASMSSKCILQSVANGTKQLMCDNSDNDLAVVYDSSSEYRNGFIGFSNPGATLLECVNKFDGFLVTGFQRNATSTTTSPSSRSSFNPSIASSSTPTLNTSDNSSMIWPYIAGAAVLILATAGLCFAYKGRIKQSLQNGGCQLFSRHSGSQESIALASVSSGEEQSNYNSISFNNERL